MTTEQFLINFTPQETRVALLQQGNAGFLRREIDEELFSQSG
jgi:hypothetical protein